MRRIREIVGLAALIVLLSIAGVTTDGEQSPQDAEEASDDEAPVTQIGDDSVRSKSSFDLNCYTCHMGVDLLMLYHRTGAPKSLVLKTVGLLCTILGIEKKPMCTGYVDAIGKHLFAIFDKDVKREIKGTDICAMALRGKCELSSKRLNNWKLDIPDLDNEPKAPARKWNEIPQTTQKILHLTDVHLQLGYQVGTDANCGYPMCCDPSIQQFLMRRQAAVAAAAKQNMDFDGFEEDSFFANMSGAAATTSPKPPVPASPVGEYQCDLPVWTAESMLRNIREVHPDISYIMLTGDFPGHGTWHQGRSENVEATNDVVDLIRQTFPDVPVFPNVGNHESYPVNMFPEVPDANFSIAWLYEDLAEKFKVWLPDEEQQRTIKDAGYYSVLAREGLRVISINTNYCNNFNFWLALNFTDPHNHLQWLYYELKKAEDNGESVYILGHIPTGSASCTGRWAEEFNRIIRRFRNTVTAQFFGHTHRDEFQVAFSSFPSNDGVSTVRKPTSITYIAPSMTPIDSVNPGYRVYTIHGAHANSSNQVFDHQTFWLDLARAKAKSGNSSSHDFKVEFQPLYTARQALNGRALSPSNWYEYALKMSADKSLFAQFRKRMSRNGPATATDHFTHEEWKSTLCRQVTSWSLGGLQTSKECKDLSRNVDRLNPWAWWHYLVKPGRL